MPPNQSGNTASGGKMKQGEKWMKNYNYPKCKHVYISCLAVHVLSIRKTFAEDYLQVRHTKQ